MTVIVLSTQSSTLGLGAPGRNAIHSRVRAGVAVTRAAGTSGPINPIPDRRRSTFLFPEAIVSSVSTCERYDTDTNTNNFPPTMDVGVRNRGQSGSNSRMWRNRNSPGFESNRIGCANVFYINRTLIIAGRRGGRQERDRSIQLSWVSQVFSRRRTSK